MVNEHDTHNAYFSMTNSSITGSKAWWYVADNPYKPEKLIQVAAGKAELNSGTPFRYISCV